MRSYRPEELFDADGAPVAAITATTPTGQRRMSANPYANGGVLRRALDMPDLRQHAVAVPHPGAVKAEATRVMGDFLRAVLQANAEAHNFRIVGPDETASNRLQDGFKVTDRAWTIHRRTYRRTNHGTLHVRGTNEEGTTTTPFDMTVLNSLDRYHLVLDVLERVPAALVGGSGLQQVMQAKLLAHHAYIREHGEDMPEIRDWTWKPAPR